MTRVIQIGGLPIRNVTAAGFIRFLDRRTRGAGPLLVGFVNHHFVVACRDLDGIVADPKNIVLLNDGIGVEIAARLTHGLGFKENMNGTDLLPRYLREASGDLSVFLLGGAPDVVAKAAAMIEAMPKRRVAGFVDGFSFWGREAEILRAIDAAKPDVLLVGFGNPKQERWILEKGRFLDVTIIFAVGALFEWMTGSRRRAPPWMRQAHLEWVYRLAIEPRRLAKRYSVDVAHFFWLVWTHRPATSKRRRT